MLSLKTHNVLDYLLGAIFLISPWFFHFEDVLEARLLFLGAGVALIAYSLFTNYHYSIARVLPLGLHMTIDAVLGVFMILAPVLLGYRQQLSQAQYVVHVVMGVATVGFVALTKPKSESTKTLTERVAIRQDLENLS